MRMLLWTIGGLVVVLLVGLAGVLAFDAPTKPPVMASISNPFAAIDYSDMPSLQSYAARDGTRLDYRVYPGGSAQVVVLIHGSSDDGSGMHPLAKALSAAGASVYVPSLRGHYNSGRRGDIDYIGQLEDDLGDFVKQIRPLHPEASLSLIGFSSGGGFVLRVIGRPEAQLFDRFILISPALPRGAPTLRASAGGKDTETAAPGPMGASGSWISLALPRIIALTVLNRVGIDWFNGLPIVAFATAPDAATLTSAYSFRLAVDFGAPKDYLAALGRSNKPTALLVGGADELFYPDRFAPLLGPVRPDLSVTIVPGLSHIGMSVAPDGVAAIRKTFLDMTAPAAG
jgi:non-heme chloroperoxidase